MFAAINILTEFNQPFKISIHNHSLPYGDKALIVGKYVESCILFRLELKNCRTTGVSRKYPIKMSGDFSQMEFFQGFFVETEFLLQLISVVCGLFF